MGIVMDHLCIIARCGGMIVGIFKDRLGIITSRIYPELTLY